MSRGERNHMTRHTRLKPKPLSATLGTTIRSIIGPDSLESSDQQLHSRLTCHTVNPHNELIEIR